MVYSVLGVHATHTFFEKFFSVVAHTAKCTSVQ